MICIQQALHRFEAHDGLRLGPPRVPERLLEPLRAIFRAEGVELDDDYYLQSFLLQPCPQSVLDLCPKTTLPGDSDVPSLVQISFYFMNQAAPGLSRDEQQCWSLCELFFALKE